VSLNGQWKTLKWQSGVDGSFQIYFTFEKQFKDNPQLRPGTHEDIRRYFTDFLWKTYCQVCNIITDKLHLGNWSETIIHFVFSVPALWVDCPVAKDYETIVRDAGFGREEKHSVEFGLNEAEAAAIYTAFNFKRKYLVDHLNDRIHSKAFKPFISPAVISANEEHNLKQCDIVLFVNSGNDTTDIIALEVKDIRK